MSWLQEVAQARRAAQAYASPEAAVLTKVFALLIDDYLNEVAYDAELAGLSFSMRSTVSGFLVSFYGRDPYPPCLQLRFALLLFRNIFGTQRVPDRCTDCSCVRG